MSSERSIPVTISSSKIHREFADVIRRVHSGKEHFIVERDGLPVAAIISINEYESFIKRREQQEQDRP